MSTVPTRALRRLQRAGRERIHRTWREHPALARAALPWGERLHALRAQVRPRRPDRPVELVVHELARARPHATFVQVGAHDGTQLDPLREAILGSRWSGVMVEPVPYVFERLAARYRANPRIALENVAVADEDGVRPFHFLAEAAAGDGVWKWYDALGSFRRDVVLSHGELVADIEQRLVTVDVPCATFTTICERNGLDRVDVVQIDTEGYDREVLELIDLHRFGPDLVIYEHLHLDPADRAAAEQRLLDHGFELVSDGMDTLGVTASALAHPGVARAFEHAGTVLGGET
ncbi:MAG: FkbM family methyltransferase [Acidimicrobiia bacterium]|jgi:FkbM family methyltransferase